jgi:hypothetical protein
MSRDLSDGERKILSVIKQLYGPQNTEDDVEIYDPDEAVLWVKDSSGSAVLFASLTNLAEWLADGTISNETELLEDWLTISDQ